MSVVSSWTIEGCRGEAVIGNAHAPAGLPRATVLVAHGFKGYKDYGMFPRIATTLAGAGCIAHRFNFSHSGMTERIETFERPDLFERDTWQTQVTDLRRVIDAVAGGVLPGKGMPLFLFGHSRGGVTSLLTAAGLATAPGAPATLAGVITASAPATCNSLSPAEEKALLEHGFLPSPSSRTGQVLRIGRCFLDEQRADPAAHDLLARVREIRVPVLVVHGTADPTVPGTAAEALAEALGDRATLRLVPGANHVFDTPNPLAADAPSSPALQFLLDEVVGFVAEKGQRD